MTDGQGEQRCGIEAGTGGSVYGPEPAEVRVEVFGGDATESAHPVFQPGVIGIDVLDMPGTTDSLAGSDIDRVMFNIEFSSRRHHDRVSFGTKNDVLGQDRAQPRNDIVRVIDLQNEVGRRAGAISGNQYGHLLVGQAALRGPTPALAGPAIKPMPLAFGGAQEVRLVGLGDTGKQLSAKLFGRSEKSMSPAKGRRSGDAQAIASASKREPVTQHVRVADPLAAQMQMRQRCARQNVERACAPTAQESRQTTALTVLDDMLCPAMRARRTRRVSTLDDLDSRQWTDRYKFAHHDFSLRVSQSANLCDQSHQFPLPHFIPPGTDAHAPQRQYAEVYGSLREPIHINRYYSQIL